MKFQVKLAPELWSGLASMLVVLPASVAFGALVFAPLGPAYAASGAVAGVVGAIVIGVVAPLLGGTKRLISGPSAPAAAVMSAMTYQLSRGQASPEHAVLLISLCGLAAGAMQAFFGAIGGGKLVKYIPYPVSAGYLSGVALLIVLSQLPGLLGFPAGVDLGQGIFNPRLWTAPSLTVGAVTIGMIALGPRLSKTVPAAVIGVAGGIAAYFAMTAFDHRLLTLAGNPFVVGSIRSAGLETVKTALGRWPGTAAVTLDELKGLGGHALTLSILLSFDTLKTCVAVDSMSATRHDSNRELLGQGIANMASALAGGMPGSGQSGATMVNINSGAQSSVSSALEGVFCLAAFVILGTLLAWMPKAALAGALMMVSWRMFDLKIFSLLKQRATLFDFGVVAVVMVVAVLVNLLSAAVAGVALSAALFIREQVRSSVIRRKTTGDKFFSKQQRVPSARSVLEAQGSRTAICQLQGSLFFGTADQLYSELEGDLNDRQFIILDLRRVQSVDLTAAHVLKQMGARLAKQRGVLALSGLPAHLASGLSLRDYFDNAGLVQGRRSVVIFSQLDDALSWIEDRILTEQNHEPRPSAPDLGLGDVDLLQDFGKAPLNTLRACLEERTYAKGAALFKKGDSGDELFIIRRGRVRIVLPLSGDRDHHVATFTRGDSFGEMAFLDGGARSADAIADSDVALYMISRKRFDEASRASPEIAGEVFSRLARMLALRLRTTNNELTALQDE